jgi:hypothetical protein
MPDPAAGSDRNSIVTRRARKTWRFKNFLTKQHETPHYKRYPAPQDLDRLHESTS